MSKATLIQELVTKLDDHWYKTAEVEDTIEYLFDLRDEGTYNMVSLEVPMRLVNTFGFTLKQAKTTTKFWMDNCKALSEDND